MNYIWTQNNYPPTIYEGKCENTGDGIGGVTHGFVSGISPAFSAYTGSFFTLEDAKASLINNYENRLYFNKLEDILKSVPNNIIIPRLDRIE